MRKQICFTIPGENIQSGIVKVVIPLVNKLAATGKYDISVLSVSAKKIGTLKLNSNVKFIKMPFINKNNKMSKILVLVNNLSKLFAAYQPDTLIVSGTEYVLPISIALGSKCKKIKLIMWEHRNFLAGPKFRLEWMGKRYALKRWDNIMCITKRDAYQYVNYAHDGSKVRQIYNLSEMKINRREYNRISKKIISCGTLSHVKGFDMLMEVARKIFKKHKDWKWDIYGDGEERNKLKYFIDFYGLGNNVFLKGYQENIKELYNDYSFFVLTSRTEGMGMVIVEALRVGLPVISFDIPCGPSDVIKDGINGFLIKPFDLEEMAIKINNLMEDQKLRMRLSLQSECCLREFSKDYIIKKWIMLLDGSEEI